MALAAAVKGARYIAQQVTWTDEDGTAVDLTGVTLTGYKRSKTGGAAVAIDGSLTPDADQVTNKGVFAWAYGAVDVSTVGQFNVQFIATYVGGLKEKTLITTWTVNEALDP